MSGSRIGDALRFLERQVPLDLAEDWDRSGFQVGDPEAPLSRIIVALDPTRATIEEAIRQRAELILTHHPLFLSPLKNLDLSGSPAALAALLIKNSVALYSAHTNLDRVEGGVNDLLADALGLTSLRPLGKGEPAFKVAVTLPESHADGMVDAMAGAGGGRIGRYEGCAFTASGVGIFTPGPGARPFLGAPGVKEVTGETRIEMTVPQSRLAMVIAAIRSAHPYEEPVVDVYPLMGQATTGALGRVGELDQPMELGAFAAFVAEKLQCGAPRLVGDSSSIVRTVAVCGGSGASLWRLARAQGADLLVTGDVKYHDALDASQEGFALLDAGHCPTERVAVTILAALMERFSMESSGDLAVSALFTPDPFLHV